MLQLPVMMIDKRGLTKSENMHLKELNMQVGIMRTHDTLPDC